MSSQFSHAVPFLPVQDLKETIAYYRDQLGFSNEWFWEDTDAGINRNDLRLLFMQGYELGRGYMIIDVGVRSFILRFNEIKFRKTAIFPELSMEKWQPVV